MSLIRKISKGRSARYKNKNKKEAEEARVEESKKAPEDDGGTYAEEPQNSDAKKQNGSAFRTNSLGSGTRTPPLERKSKFSIGKLLRPWKWKRKKKSDKLEAVSRSEYTTKPANAINLIFPRLFQRWKERYQSEPIGTSWSRKASFCQRAL
jgi:hypothetical protein